MADFIFRVLFVSIFILFWIIRIYYVRKTRDPDAPRSRENRRAALKQEGWTGILLVILTYAEIIVVILFLWAPQWMLWADLTLPVWIHWMGFVVIVCSIPYMVWVHRTLGQHYSYALETKTEQKLISSGPYSRIRHPLYSAHTLFNLGMILLTAYIPLILFAIIGVPFTYARMMREEKMMIEKFGSQYEEYMKKSGRIFPKL